MSKKDDLDRLNLILLKINFIQEICETDGIVKSLEDIRQKRPAILMHFTSIAEQFNKIKDNDLLDLFDKDDIKGAIDTRNFIAHDYEGINMAIIEFIIRSRLPLLKNIILNISDKNYKLWKKKELEEIGKVDLSTPLEDDEDYTKW